MGEVNGSDGMSGRRALVTGAAGGIGGAIVELLSARGVAVAAVDRDTDRLADDDRWSGKVWVHRADVSDPDQVEEVVDAVERDLGPIDYLVNCAGILRPGDVVGMSDEDWLDTIRVNCTGVFLVSRAVVRRMVPRRAGAVVTIGSNAAGTARMNMAAYAASKAAVAAFTRCLGLEVARYGIRCNVVAPGSTDTPMVTALWNGGDAERVSIDGSLESFRTGIPLGKLAHPLDVAHAVHFLLSDQAAHVTMHDLTVDGGAALGH
ncbi:2,3-dihydro-2,3-dihydroxybenzoate dehydrogenase [Saccharothrix saharensis]|uniref:2,3-dihydro-2,3-dihydroxybenzoate dehydrogenase n=1 Tax=Saccharothrix saharensis TaxID=571190 RepID=A0A543JR15_9PSEU|nr:2,3-dihydro-2,3-dihydroxybenzoate dehydrogenase [Saccharothrix saharensis]